MCFGKSRDDKLCDMVMTLECFFSKEISDVLQHIAVFFEVGAIFLVWKDYKNRESDLASKGISTMVTGLSVPHSKRSKELLFAYIVGVVAICMELYQLASQYWGC